MKDENQEVVDAIEAHYADRLSEWEVGFVDSISRQIGEGKSLTPLQQQKLDEVFERVSNKGRGW